MNQQSHSRAGFGAPPPSKQVDPRLRALIDEAVREGRVRKVPAGVSGMPQLLWDESISKLRYIDTPRPFIASERVRTEAPPKMPPRRKPAPINTERERRRAMIVDMRASGLTRAEIAERLNITVRIVAREIGAAKAAEGSGE